jgi:thiamine-phosphate pyrophosphorylase
MRGLYAIVDVGLLEAHSVDVIAFARAVLAARPAALQLRAKFAPPREVLSLLRALAPACREISVPLVANDRPDLAILAGCDMVHVGQSDISVERVRRLAPGLGIGVSTHTLHQLDAALAARPTYVAYGPVFETANKKDPDPVVGVAGLREAYGRAARVGIPLVAIGGISRDRASGLAGMADAVAVIGDLFPPRPPNGERASASEWFGQVTARARALGERFGGGLSAPSTGAVGLI